MIIFSEHDHKYTHLETGNNLNGWTSLIKNFTSPFNKEDQAICSAYKLWLGSEKYNEIVKSRFKRLFSLDPYEVSSYLQSSIVGLPMHLVDELLYEWDYAGILGSDFHLKLENLSYSRGYEINPFTSDRYETIKLPKEYDNQLAHDKLINLEDGYYPELLVSDYTMDQSNTVVTMIDKCFIKTDEHGRRIVDVDDIKGFSLDTKIPSENGWINMGDIKVGDVVFDGKGNKTKVKYVSKIHHNPCFKIKFDNNEELICDHEHKWVTSKCKKGSKDIYYRESIEMTTSEIFDYYSKNKLKLAIEINDLKTGDINLPIDPYVFGLWLADGNRTCGTISCNNDSVWDEIHNLGYKTSIDHNRNDKYCESRTIFCIRKWLIQLGVLNNKFVPDMYLRSSKEQRLNLLRGYMDGDGYYHKERCRYGMGTTNLRQAKDIQTIVCSLGYKCTILPYKTKGFGKENIQAYQLSFRMDENPFKVRNKDIPTNYTYKNNFNYIKSIEKIDIVPTKCIAVESEEKTYLVGNSLIMTHNSNKSRPYASKDKKMLDPLSDLYDNTEEKYKLQVCFGSKLMQTHGFTPRYCAFTHFLDYDENKAKIYLAKYDEKLMSNFQKAWKKLNKK